MSKIKAVLFDFDGVIANTEPLYDEFTDELAKKYNLAIDNFSTLLKGTTNAYMVENYFSHLPKSEITKIYKQIDQFESIMPFPPVAGVFEFIRLLKKQGCKIGLVTSSNDVKIKRALSELNLDAIFDTKVTEDRITESKPDPMCYLLAATDLGLNPLECVVFEDSFHGIDAAKNAGMAVVALSTSISKDELQKRTEIVIPDFLNIDLLLHQLF